MTEEIEEIRDIIDSIDKETFMIEISKKDRDMFDSAIIKSLLSRIAPLEANIREDLVLKMSKHFKNYTKAGLTTWINVFLKKKEKKNKKVDTGDKPRNILIMPEVEFKNGSILIYDEGELEKQIILNYNITNRIWNQLGKKTSYYGKEATTNSPVILEISKIRSIMKENGGSNSDIVQFLNYLSLTNTIKNIKTIEFYGFYHKDNQIKFPPNYIATNVMGHGKEFFEYFYNKNTTHAKGRNTWFEIVRTAENGIGMTNALMLGAFSISSIFHKHFKNINSIVPYLFLLGPVESGKTPAAKYIGCITKYPCLHTNEELTAAVFSQLGSSGCFPLIIDEADDLREDIQNKIKVLATADLKRRRSTKRGERRDAPEFLRTLIFTANNIPEFMLNSQATLDRTTFIIIDKKPTNFNDWKNATKKFGEYKESIANYLLHEKIDYNKIILESQEKVKKLEENLTEKLSNRKRGIFEFYTFGIFLMKEIGYFTDDYLIDNILEDIKEKINISAVIANEKTMEYIRNGIIDFSNNYKTYKKLKENYDNLMSINSNDLEYKNQVATLESQRASVESNKNRIIKLPMAWLKENDEEKYWCFTFKECNELYKISRIDSFKNLEILKRTIESYGVKTFTKITRHIIDNKTKRTIYIHSSIFSK